MKKTLIAAAAIAAATGGWIVSAPVASAGCIGGNAMVGGNGGGRCDNPSDMSDGSFIRCETVYVMGFGGTNCYRVPAGTP